jgi:mRNA-degrading endonuclease RelE of RelBE toxin-antitoxin system
VNFLFTEAARTDLRRIDRGQAMNILLALTRFANTGEGDVKQLKGSKDFRPRVGDYRVACAYSKTRSGLRV